MADEPTLGEVVRRLEAIHADLKEDLREYGARLEKKVSIERHDIERRTADEVHRQMIERMTAIEAERAQAIRDDELERRKIEDQRRADRRLILTGLIVPVLIVLLQVYLSTRGAGA